MNTDVIAPVAEAPVSFLRPALWKAPEYSGSQADLDAKAAVLAQRLAQIAATHVKPRFATSLAAEDMVLNDLIVKANLPIAVFTLETGRLPQATLDLLEQVEAHYTAAYAGRDLKIDRFAPRAEDVGNYVSSYGANAFYDSVEHRKLCCQIRKVEPLARVLTGADAWLTGQRQEQAVTRANLSFAERDDARGGIAKYNPLLDWTEAEVWAYLRRHGVPVNALYAQGYASIGCDPCTRAIKQGEDVRAGRWWWESADKKECGLHEANLNGAQAAVQA